MRAESLIEPERLKDIEKAIEFITSRRVTKNKENLRQARFLTDKSLLTAWEVGHLMKSMGMKLVSAEQDALNSEFEERGGFTRDDIYYLVAPQYSTENLAKQISASLKAINSTSITVSQLMTVLVKVGTVFKLDLDHALLFCEFCAVRQGIRTPVSSKTELSIDVITNTILGL